LGIGCFPALRYFQWIEIKIMKIVTALFILSVIISACNSKEGGNTMDGGPCSYRTDTLPVILLRIEKVNPGNFDLLMRVDYIHYRDTIRYSSYTHQRYLSEDDSVFKKLRIGQRYQYLEQNITSGDCNPHIIVINLEPYTGPLKHNPSDWKYDDGTSNN
jgi:hypothetical protein